MKTASYLLLTLALAPRLHAAPAPLKASADTSAAARARLNESARAYAALRGLSMRFTARDDNSGKVSNSSGTIAFARPGKARVEAKIEGSNLLQISDGAKIYSQSEPGQYRTSLTQSRDPLSPILGRVPSALSVFLPSLVAGKNPLDEPGVKWGKAALLPSNGVSLGTTLGLGGPPITFALYFDPTDKLLRLVEASIVFKGKKSVNLTTLTEVKVNPRFASETFTFAPTKGATEVNENTMYAPELKLGAPPIALVGRDTEGLSHPLSDYKGKVLFIEFWTQLSDPFIAQLPGLLGTYAKHHDAGFEILGVALDADKTQVNAFVTANKIPFPSLYDPDGFRGANFSNYELRKVPFGVLIGKDGRVVAIDPDGNDLEAAVVKALAE